MKTASILPNILKYSIEKKASDIHISGGQPLTYRIKKKLYTMEGAGVIEAVSMKIILLELMYNDQDRVKEFMKNKDADFAYQHESGTSFRVNAFYKLWF